MRVLWNKRCSTNRRFRDNVFSVCLIVTFSIKRKPSKETRKRTLCLYWKSNGCQEIVLPREARQQFASLWYFDIFCIENSIHHQFQFSIVLLKLLVHIILLFGFVIFNRSDNKFIMFFGCVMFRTCKMQKSQADENIFYWYSYGLVFYSLLYTTPVRTYTGLP